MNKILSIFLFCIFLCTSANAQVVIGNSVVGNTVVKSGINTPSSKLTQLMKYDGLTFYNNYTKGSVTADFSAGSSTGTYTGATNGTYTTSAGVITPATTNVARFSGGYYDET